MLIHLSLVMLLISRRDRFEFNIVAPLDNGDTLFDECALQSWIVHAFIMMLACAVAIPFPRLDDQASHIGQ